MEHGRNVVFLERGGQGFAHGQGFGQDVEDVAVGQTFRHLGQAQATGVLQRAQGVQVAVERGPAVGDDGFRLHNLAP